MALSDTVLIELISMTSSSGRISIKHSNLQKRFSSSKVLWRYHHLLTQLIRKCCWFCLPSVMLHHLEDQMQQLSSWQQGSDRSLFLVWYVSRRLLWTSIMLYLFSFVFGGAGILLVLLKNSLKFYGSLGLSLVQFHNFW